MTPQITQIKQIKQIASPPSALVLKCLRSLRVAQKVAQSATLPFNYENRNGLRRLGVLNALRAAEKNLYEMLYSPRG